MLFTKKCKQNNIIVIFFYCVVSFSMNLLYICRLHNVDMTTRKKPFRKTRISTIFYCWLILWTMII